MSTPDTTIADRQPGEGEAPKNAATTMQIKRLKEYLAQAYPGAALPGEHAADTAIRLLQARSTGSLPGGASLEHETPLRQAITPRCREQYCNKPEGHTDEHGWVTYQ